MEFTFELESKNKAYLPKLATHLGLNLEELRECISAEATEIAIKMQASIGKKAGVKGTPSIYANGKLLPYGSLMPVLQEALNSVKKSP